MTILFWRSQSDAGGCACRGRRRCNWLDIKMQRAFRAHDQGALSMTGTIKSRHTIRRSPPNNRIPKYIEPWVYESKEGTTLAKLEHAFFIALEAVDALEDRMTAAKQSNKFTDVGIAADALEFAASKLAPQLKRARLSVDAAREELSAKRAKLTLQPADKTDVAAQTRRLWKVEQVAK